MADFLELLNEISSEKPCGDYLEYDAAYLELGKQILGKPEDPITGEKAQPPNWRDIQRDALALLQRSIDLQLVIYLLRAQIHLESVSGFRDGLSLLLALLETYWESIHPVLDPDDQLDPTARVNIIEELSNFESVLRPLSLAPLVDSKAVGRFSLRDIQLATDKIDLPEDVSKPDLSLIKAAFLDMPAEVLTATYLALTESADIIQRLETFVSDKVGFGNGPDLSALAALLKDMRNTFEQFADVDLRDEVSPSSDSDQLENQLQPTAASPRQQAVVGSIQSRQDVLKTLDLICKYYVENEPSSPVPILLQRAKILVSSDFMQIVQNLLPDALSQLEQIKGPDPDAN